MAAVAVTGDNYTKSEDPKSANIIDPGVWGGKVRIQYDQKTVNAYEVGSTIKVGKLPAGATFLQSVIPHGALGTDVTLQLGDADDDDRYMIASAAASAGVLEAREATGVGHRVTSETDLILKIGGATTASSDILVQIVTYYTWE